MGRSPEDASGHLGFPIALTVPFTVLFTHRNFSDLGVYRDIRVAKSDNEGLVFAVVEWALSTCAIIFTDSFVAFAWMSARAFPCYLGSVPLM